VQVTPPNYLVKSVSSSNLSQHLDSLSPANQATLKLIERLGQQHLVENWPGPGKRTSDKLRLLAQVRELDARYPGGLERYLKNAAELLEQARLRQSPYQDFEAHVPDGFRIDFGSPQFLELEQMGLPEANRCGFVLVAGGMGERLGFPGIKVALSTDAATGTPFLKAYIEGILALEHCSAARTGVRCQLPLAIMTSDETHEGTKRLLEANGYFGMQASQVVLLKQELVAALADSTPRLAVNASDPYELLTKPHGHGDVHALMHQTGVARRWCAQGIRWLLFFQDTNVLTFKSFLAALGVSARERFDVNSLAVPRVPGEAAGGIVRLVKADSVLTVNVEYNQLDDLLRATPGSLEDVADHTGYSPYPGNTNVFILALETYVEVLDRTGGSVPEFVNPKYADAARTTFKTPTRLECMMQDYPRLAESARVGFTQFDRSACFSAVKNSLAVAAARQASQPPLPAESASTSEADLYAFNRRVLRLAGAEIEDGPSETYQGVGVALFPIVWLSPELTTPLERVVANLFGVRISKRSTLVIDAAEFEVRSLDLDGALEIRAVSGARIVLAGLAVKNRGWKATVLENGGDHPPDLAIRGYRFERQETLLIEATKPGEYIVDTATLAGARTDLARPGYQVISL